MNWIPTIEEKEYLNLVLAMTTDCLCNKGTADLSTYTTNLRMICAHLEGRKGGSHVVEDDNKATD